MKLLFAALVIAEHIVVPVALVAIWRRLIDSERREQILWDQIHRYEDVIHPAHPFEIEDVTP